MDDTIKTIEQIVEKLTPVVTKAGTVTWNVALRVEQADALNWLIQGFLGVLVACVLFALTVVCCLKMRKVCEAGDSDEAGNWFGLAGVLGAIGIIVLFAGGSPLFAPWNWITLFHPDLGIAHEVWVKALSK